MTSPIQVLVIDDDPVAQKVMKLFLERSGYAPTLVGSAKAGLEIALRPDAPGIIVLDWMLPDLDGPLVCRKLREAKPKIRPYIIFLSSKHDKSDIGQALDSGADDYVTKPFNVVEFQARLRVARRSLDHQIELQRQIASNEELSQRNSLLGELISNRQGTDKSASRNTVQPTLETQSPLSRFTTNEVTFMLSAAFMELRLALEAVDAEPTGVSLPAATPLAWAGMAVAKTGCWFDVVVATGPSELRSLFRHSLGRECKGEDEALVFLAEVARVVGAGFGRMLRSRHGDVHSVLISRPLGPTRSDARFPSVNEGEVFQTKVEGQVVRVLTVRTSGSRRRIRSRELRPLDILATPFPPPEVSPVPLFREGVVITTRFMERLRFQMEETRLEDDAEIWRPSSVAAHFHPDV